VGNKIISQKSSFDNHTSDAAMPVIACRLWLLAGNSLKIFNI